MTWQIKCIALLFIVTVAFSSGALVQTWKLESHYTKELLDRASEYAALELTVEKQNSGTALLQEQTRLAKLAQQEAEKRANFFFIKYNEARNKADEIVPLTCSDMLEQLKRIN